MAMRGMKKGVNVLKSVNEESGGLDASKTERGDGDEEEDEDEDGEVKKQEVMEEPMKIMELGIPTFRIEAPQEPGAIATTKVNEEASVVSTGSKAKKGKAAPPPEVEVREWYGRKRGVGGIF
jgi:hypothetical protein